MVVTSSDEWSSVELEVLELVSLQILCLNAFFFVPGPPKHYMSRQWGHLPQFSRLQPKQVPHRPFEGGQLNFTINQSTVQLKDQCPYRCLKLCVKVNDLLVFSQVSLYQACQPWPSVVSMWGANEWCTVWMYMYILLMYILSTPCESLLPVFLPCFCNVHLHESSISKESDSSSFRAIRTSWRWLLTSCVVEHCSNRENMLFCKRSWDGGTYMYVHIQHSV